MVEEIHIDDVLDIMIQEEDERIQQIKEEKEHYADYSDQ